MLKKFVCTFLFIALVSCEECWNWNGEMGCQGNQVDPKPEFKTRTFQTPPKGNKLWRKEYQDMSQIAASAQIRYSNDRTAALVVIHSRINTRDGNIELKYSFNNENPISLNRYEVNQNFQKELSIKVIGINSNTKKEYQLELESLNFIWQNPKINQEKQYEKGQKGAIIELFGWPYEEIEKECESLGKMGYLGVKVFPPQEGIKSENQIQNGELNPWYWVYQPVSYKLTSRMGTRKQLRKMIVTCRKNNVRIYADAVINHMTGGGNDAFPTHRNSHGGHCSKWGAKDSFAGSPYFTHSFAHNYTFAKEKPGMEFPAVPWGPMDFHCERSLASWSSGFSLNYGWLVGLSDLNTEKENVQQRIADYLTDLLSIGFSGFRIDAAKHITPKSLAQILNKFKRNLGNGDLPDDFITWLEVIIGGEKDLLMCNDNYYNFGRNFENEMKKEGLSESDVFKIKIWSSDYPKEFPICGHWVIPSERYAIQNDDHDQQFGGSSSRDMGDKGSVLVKEQNIEKHRHFNKLLFSRKDGNWKIKLILSSYTFKNDAKGFPDGLSDCKLCQGDYCNECTKSMPKSKCHDSSVCGYEDLQNNWNNGVYTRVHRDKGIIIEMRKWMGLPVDRTNEQLGLPKHCEYH